jgi:hypothetical protein
MPLSSCARTLLPDRAPGQGRVAAWYDTPRPPEPKATGWSAIVAVRGDQAVESRGESIASSKRWAKSVDEARGWLLRWTSNAQRASST